MLNGTFYITSDRSSDSAIIQISRIRSLASDNTASAVSSAALEFVWITVEYASIVSCTVPSRMFETPAARWTLLLNQFLLWAQRNQARP